MTPREALWHHLELTRNLIQNEDLIYKGAADMVLKHGKWYDVTPYPEGYPVGGRRACFGNALVLAAVRGWKYVEGYALGLPENPMPWIHAWNVDHAGTLVDNTWSNQGLAYIGIEFSVARAADAIWNGDTSVLQDWHRGFPLFTQVWTGETPENAVPEPEVVRLLREGRIKELLELGMNDRLRKM